jgi:hypothetical protein
VGKGALWARGRWGRPVLALPLSTSYLESEFYKYVFHRSSNAFAASTKFYIYTSVVCRFPVMCRLSSPCRESGCLTLLLHLLRSVSSVADPADLVKARLVPAVAAACFAMARLVQVCDCYEGGEGVQFQAIDVLA